MVWRVAYSLQTLLAQLDEMFPQRNKASDGSIGDPAHSSRDSDHNPDPFGVVRARDFTHDRRSVGLNCHWLAETLTRSNDPRIKYIIWNKRIWKKGTWTTYTGSNPHTKHLHLSVVPDKKADNTSRWDLGLCNMSMWNAEAKAAYDAVYNTVVGDENWQGSNLQKQLNHIVNRIDISDKNVKDLQLSINKLLTLVEGLQ